jgi:two-component system cell cycle sensor histidine kinase/response regulator CckA
MAEFSGTNAPESASTAFEIYLPVLDPTAQTNGAPDPDSPASLETVLVAEDEQPVRELIRDVLRLPGYAVLEARDGDEAVALAERHPGMIHLLIADMVMPGAPVTTVVQRVAAAHPELKVLYVSGYTDELIRQHGLLRLGPDFLQKPFTVEGLARKVRERLDAS